MRFGTARAVQISFFDYLPDLEYFGKNVQPLMIEAGLREKTVVS